MASSQRRFPSIRHTASKAATYGTSHIKLEPCDAPCTVAPKRGGKSRVRPSDPCVDGTRIIMPWNTVGRDLILSDVYTGEFAVIDDESGDEREWDISEDDNIFAMITDSDGIDDDFDNDVDEKIADDETDGSITEYEWELALSIIAYEEDDEARINEEIRENGYSESVSESTFQSLLETDAYDDVYGDTAHLDWDDSLFDEDYELMLDGEYEAYRECVDQEDSLEELQIALERRSGLSAYDRSVKCYNADEPEGSHRKARAIRPLTEAARAIGTRKAAPNVPGQKGWWMKSKPGISWKLSCNVNQFKGNDRREVIEVKERWMNSYTECEDGGLTEYVEMLEFYAEFMVDVVDNDVDPLWHMQMEAAWYWNCEATQRELEVALGPVYLIDGKLVREADDDVTDHGYVDYDQVSAVG